MSGGNYVLTPNYSLIKPVTDSDDDLWGTHWNLNADTLDQIIHGIDTRPSGGASIGTTPPTAPGPGTFWWDNNSGNLMLFYNDGNSTQWVPATATASGAMGGSGTAGVSSFNTRTGAVSLTSADVTNALTYTPYNGTTNPNGYQTQAQVNTAVAPYAGNVGRNVLHNPLMNVQQRGQGSWTAAGNYMADRWQLHINAPDTASARINTLADIDRTTIGDLSATYCLSVNVTGTAGGWSGVSQRIERVRRLAGQTVIVSFYAQVSSGTPKLAVNANTLLGTGGSPSNGSWGTAGVVTLSNNWARYSVTIAVPSIAGLTLGTNGDDHLWLVFFMSGGSTGATSGNIGAQTANFNLYGVQLEVAQAGQTQPTNLEKPDPQQDLAKCMRFYCLVAASVRGAAASSGAFFDSSVSWPPMRGLPNATLLTAPNAANQSGGSPYFGVTTAYGGRYEINSAAAGDCYALGAIYGLSADL